MKFAIENSYIEGSNVSAEWVLVTLIYFKFSVKFIF